MQVEDIITRLGTQVSAFEGRIEGAAELAILVKGGRAPNRTPVAYVLPLGLTAQPADSAAGIHRQGLIERFGVVIVLSIANDLRGAKGLPQIHTLRDSVIAALAAWAPAAAWDVLSLTRGELKSLNSGTITYQVDFSTTDQLRI